MVQVAVVQVIDVPVVDDCGVAAVRAVLVGVARVDRGVSGHGVTPVAAGAAAQPSPAGCGGPPRVPCVRKV